MADDRRLSRRQLLRYTAVASGALAGASMLASDHQAAAAAARAGGTLAVGVVAEPVTLDPPAAFSTSDEKISINLFDKLVQQEVGSYRVVPALAESWAVSSDGKLYTFRLRKGVRFHDGTPFNAEAAKISIDRMIDETSPLYNMSKFPVAKGRIGVIKEVQAVDDSTLRIALSRPLTPFIDYMATVLGVMISPTAAKQLFTSFGERPVGTGPFKFSSWEKGQRLVLERNTDYWRGAPKLERIVAVTYPEAEPRLTALKTGSVQLIESVPPDDIPQIQSDPTLQLVRGASPHVWYVVLNNKFKPLSDVRVRRALSHAVNKQAIVGNILRGTATAADGPLEPTIFKTYQTNITKYEYDPAKAKRLLADAGYPNGFEVAFSVPTSGQGMLEPVAMATYLQANFAQVGVKAQIKTFEWGAYQKIRLAGDFEMAAFSWTPGIGNPDILLYNLFHSSQQPPNGYNNAFWANERVDRLLDLARVTTDDKIRIESYKETQRIITAEAPRIFICHAANLVAASRKLQGFKAHPTTEMFFPPSVSIG